MVLIITLIRPLTSLVWVWKVISHMGKNVNIVNSISAKSQLEWYHERLQLMIQYQVWGVTDLFSITAESRNYNVDLKIFVIRPTSSYFVIIFENGRSWAKRFISVCDAPFRTQKEKRECSVVPWRWREMEILGTFLHPLTFNHATTVPRRISIDLVLTHKGHNFHFLLQIDRERNDMDCAIHSLDFETLCYRCCRGTARTEFDIAINSTFTIKNSTRTATQTVPLKVGESSQMKPSRSRFRISTPTALHIVGFFRLLRNSSTGADATRSPERRTDGNIFFRTRRRRVCALQ